MTDIRPITWGRRVSWPEGQRVAMTIGVALEAFERHSQYRTEGTPGRDEFSLSYADYGVNVGVWRLLELFADEDLRVSFSISGLLAEQHPELIRTIADAGHDLVAHGWANDLLMPEAGRDAERDIVARTVAAIETATGGQRPAGWAGPGSMGSKHTREILLDEGLTWTGDDASDDVPFVDVIGERRLAVLPKANLDANDLIQWVKFRNSPRVFAESFSDTFDTVYAEGIRERPGWSDMVLHAHMAGRPTLIPSVKACIAHVKRHDRVWWTTKNALAAWTLDQDFRR